ncbi:HD domain-containing protein [Streptomyces sp. MS06]|uniref:HD domain-containing protein n=1 Tax=Streptomyces sp. MS06 TaxID=3385974 RepID=UPI0039A19ACE
MTTSQLLPALPDTPAARRTLAHARRHESEPVANHSIRSYLFAVLLAEHEGLAAGADFDPDLLFHACVLHDLGTSPSAPGRQRFEVEGADMAADFLTTHGCAAADVDQVWEAITLHSSPGIAERRSALARLTRGGVVADFGIAADFVTEAQGEAAHRHHPRLNMVSALVDDIVRHAARAPQNAPRFTIAGELARERGPHGTPTTLETAAASSRWGV